MGGKTRFFSKNVILSKKHHQKGFRALRTRFSSIFRKEWCPEIFFRAARENAPQKHFSAEIEGKTKQHRILALRI